MNMPDKNDQVISKIVIAFYKLATVDFLIGYQFRKIQTKEGIDPLVPPIEAFETHLPRIEKFWRMILLGEKLEDSIPFDLIGIHRELNIRKGELDRWVILFLQTLDSNADSLDDSLKEEWIKKVRDFQRKFTKVFFT
jgi:hypothetical protein